MAAVELATGYISLAVSTKGMGKQITSEFSGVEKQAAKSGQAGGKKLGGGLLAGVKGIAGPIAALFAVGKVVDFFKDANAEARESEKVGKRTTNVIKTTGGAAKVTAKQVGSLSTAISNKTGIDDEAIQSGANLLLTFTKVRNEAGKGNDIFNQATQTVQDMSVAFDQSGKASAIQLGKALNDPIKGVSSLSRVGVQFTEQQKKQIKTLVESGNVLGAQKIILGELKTQVGGAAEASATGTQKMAIGWANLKEQIGTAFLPLIDKVAGAIGTRLLPLLSQFVSFVSRGIGPVFKEIATAVSGFFATLSTGMTENDIATPFEQLAFAARGLAPVLRQIAGFITGTVMPAFVSWAQFMAAQWLPIIRQVGGFILTSIVPAFRAVVNFIVTQLVPGFLSIVETVKGLYAVLFPIISQIVGVILSKFQEMRPQIMSIWNSVKEIIVGAMFIIREVIQAVTAIVGGIWARWGTQITAVVTKVFGGVVNIIAGVMKVISGIIKLFVALIKGDWKGAWDAVKQIFSGVWQAIKGILSVSTAVIGATLAAWWAKVKSLFAAGSTFIRGLWDRLWSGVKSTALAALNWVRDKVGTVLDKIKGAFSSARDSIKKIWDGLRDIVSKPVQWIIDHVYNKPLVPVWNRVAGLVGGPKLNAYARGGVEPYGVRPGYTPGRDTHPIMVSGGEAIMRPEFTRAVGADWVNRANKAARRGKARRFVQEGGIPGFAGGGVVGWLKGLASNVSGKVGGLAGKLKDWVLGGLRDAAAKVLNPIKNLIAQAMPNTGVGNTVGGIGKKAIDLVLDKIQSSDAAALAKVAAQGAYTGPPGTGSRGLTTWHGGRFTQRFRNTLEQAQKIAGYINVIQGGFRPATSYSGTSHRGDAIDTSWKSSVLSGLRRSGVAAWHRTPAQGFAHHIHGVPLPGRGFPGGSGIWQAQDYLRGGNGLASGGIVKGGRGGLQTWIGEGRRDELVLPLPKGWDAETLGQSQASLTVHGGIHGYSAEEIAAAIEKQRRKQAALQPSYV